MFAFTGTTVNDFSICHLFAYKQCKLIKLSKLSAITTWNVVIATLRTRPSDAHLNI